VYGDVVTRPSCRESPHESRRTRTHFIAIPRGFALARARTASDTRAVSLRPPKSSPLKPGYRLDRYELLCPIAQGGMASVWVARMQGKHGFEKLVAIKTILPKFASDFRFQQMFLDEARIASGIEHNNVAQILDLGEEHDVLYLVMEWVDGDALNKLQRALEKKGMTIPHGIVARIVADACGGLHAAHEMRDRNGAPLGVVHRDVSPHNILVSAKGVAKVIDFGIAKARDRLAGDTNTGFLKGKIQYMAPEQALGREMDGRADVWALGAILYHLYSGRPPYEGPNQLATLHLLTSAKPPLPLPASVPAPLAAIVTRALAHDAGARFSTAAEMQRALEAAMIESGVSTSNADVASFTGEHLHDRAEARKKAIELAMMAATERGRVERLLVPPSSESSSGMDEREGHPNPNEKVRSLSLAPIEELVMSPPSGLMTVAETPRARPAAPRAPGAASSVPPRGDGRTLEPLSENSSATLGSATVESYTDALPRRRRNVVLVGTAAVGVIGAIVFLGSITLGAHGPEKAPSATSFQPSSAAPPPPVVTAIPLAIPAPPAATAATPATPAVTSAAPSAPSAPRAAFHSASAPPTAPHATAARATTRRSVDDGF
jgi:serine/threonine protein kinase